MSANFCSNCGQSLLPEVKFCGNCGQGVGTGEQGQTVPTATPPPTPELIKAGTFAIGDWQGVSNETLKNAYVNRRRYTTEHEKAITAEMIRRGLPLGFSSQIESDEQTCPHCYNLVESWASVCPRCETDLTQYGADPSAVASRAMIFGIGSLVLSSVSGVIQFKNIALGLILFIAALVFAIVGLKCGMRSKKALFATGRPSGAATAGIVCGIIVLALSSIGFLIGLIAGLGWL